MASSEEIAALLRQMMGAERRRISDGELYVIGIMTERQHRITFDALNREWGVANAQERKKNGGL